MIFIIDLVEVIFGITNNSDNDRLHKPIRLIA